MRHYKDQLVAGYSKTTVTGGLLVYMPDYGKISKPLSPHGAETKRAATTYGLRLRFKPSSGRIALTSSLNARPHVVEPNQINVFSFAVLRNFE